MPVQWLPGTTSTGNAYVCKDVLIDAGVLPMAVEPYREDIRTIILTHCHYDHTAHVLEIAQMCEAEIAIHRSDAAALHDDMQSVALLFGERAPHANPHRLLNDGERIGPLTVIHTPGHTPGSICLYREERGVLFSGDTVFTEGSFGRYDLPGGNLRELKRSMEILAELPVEALYPGHGFPALHGGRKHIVAARRLLQGTLS
ncbi:MAG: MBL fold metallo-hydrolase [Methanomicrobiales archaeon]|nr:MBL fold metallo-hydrolase [Methanomicrobiales archaeon]